MKISKLIAMLQGAMLLNGDHEVRFVAVIEAIAEFADVCSRERLPPWAKPQMLLSTWDRVFAICDGFEVNT